MRVIMCGCMDRGDKVAKGIYNCTGVEDFGDFSYRFHSQFSGGLPQH